MYYGIHFIPIMRHSELFEKDKKHLNIFCSASAVLLLKFYFLLYFLLQPGFVMLLFACKSYLSGTLHLTCSELIMKKNVQKHYFAKTDK